MNIKTYLFTTLSLFSILTSAIAGWVPGNDPAGQYYKTGLDETYYGVNQGVNLYVSDGPDNSLTHLTIQSGSSLNGSIDARGYSMITAINTGIQGTVWGRENSIIDLVSGGYGNINIYNDGTLYLSAPSFGQVRTNQTGHFVMTGGGQTSFTRAFDDSTMELKGGVTLSYVVASGNAKIDISGGTFSRNPQLGAYIRANQNSEITISGGNFTFWGYGHVNEVKFNAAEDGILKFVGSDFTVGGYPVSGLLDLEQLVDLAAITKTVGTTHYTYSGTLQGTLQSGQSFKNDFWVQHAIDSAESANIYLFSSSCLVNEELQEQLDEANVENAILTAQLNSANAQIANLEAVNSQVESDLVASQLENSNLTMALDEANTMIQQLSEEISMLYDLVVDPAAADLLGSELMREYALEVILEAIANNGEASAINSAQSNYDTGVSKQDSGEYRIAIRKYSKAVDFAISSTQ